MNTNTPNHGGVPPHRHDLDLQHEHDLIDEIPGDPSVPASVWRTPRRPDDPATGIGARLAYRLVAAYTRAGDQIVDLTPDHALAADSARGGRAHHLAWFTDHHSLIISGPTPPDPAPQKPSEPGMNLTEGDGTDEAPSLGAWFGDDLTDPNLPPTDPAAGEPDSAEGLCGATGLVVATWPLHDLPPVHEARLAALLRGCARLLREGGCLVLVVGSTIADPATRAAAPTDFGPLVEVARAQGLTYLQHIVAVAADTDADRFTYYVTDEELLALAHNAGQPWSLAHLRVHADLLVFAPIGGRHA